MGIERIINILTTAAGINLQNKVRDLLTTEDPSKTAPVIPTGTEQPELVVPPSKQAPNNTDQLQQAALKTITVGANYGRTDGVVPTLNDGLKVADDPNSGLTQNQIATVHNALKVPERIFTQATRDIASSLIQASIAPVVATLLPRLNFNDEKDRDKFLAAARTAQIFAPTLKGFGLVS